LTDFIVSKWRQDSLVKLVNSNGNIKVTLDISVIDFEKMWLSFLEEKYKLSFGFSTASFVQYRAALSNQ
jgi:hypothetical protein